MIVEKTNSYGVPVNGTWDGMRGHLQRRVSDISWFNNKSKFVTFVIEPNIFFISQDVDLACAPFVGGSDHNILELSAYGLGDVFGILGKYPNPEISVYGITKVFSPSVNLFLNNYNCS